MKVGDLVKWTRPTKIDNHRSKYKITRVDTMTGIIVCIETVSGPRLSSKTNVWILCENQIRKKKMKYLKVLSSTD